MTKITSTLIALLLCVGTSSVAQTEEHICEGPFTQKYNECSRAKATSLIREILPYRGDNDQFSSTAWLACNGTCLIGSDSEGSVFIPLDEITNITELPGLTFIGRDVNTWCMSDSFAFVDDDGAVFSVNRDGATLTNAVALNVPAYESSSSTGGMLCDFGMYLTINNETYMLDLYDASSGAKVALAGNIVGISPSGQYVLQAIDDDIVLLELQTQKSEVVRKADEGPARFYFSIEEGYIVAQSYETSQNVIFDLSTMTEVATIDDPAQETGLKIVIKNEDGYAIETLQLSRRDYGDYLQYGR